MARPIHGDRGEGRLARWSRLKRESATAAPVRGGAASPVAIEEPKDGDLPDVHVPAEAAEPDAARVEAIIAELPPVEALDGESDYTGFLADGVPEELTRAALRRLWRTDPVLANVDGLNDYDEDFSIITPIARAVGEALSGDDEAPSCKERTPEPHAPERHTKAADADVGRDRDGSEPAEDSPEEGSAEPVGKGDERRVRADASAADGNEDALEEEG